MLIDIREEMAREADFDADLYLEMIRTGRWTDQVQEHPLGDMPSAGISKKRRTED